jgi:hypothetical protein
MGAAMTASMLLHGLFIIGTLTVMTLSVMFARHYFLSWFDE